MNLRASATNNSKTTTVPWSNHLSSMRSPETLRTTGRKQLGPINEWRDAYRSGASSSPIKPMLKTPYDNSFKGEPKGTGDNINRSSHADVRPYGGHVQKDLLKYSEASKPDAPPQSPYPRSTAPKHSVSFPDHEQPGHSGELNENTTGIASNHTPKNNNLTEISKGGGVLPRSNENTTGIASNHTPKSNNLTEISKGGGVLPRSNPFVLGPLVGAGPLPSKNIDPNTTMKRYQYNNYQSQRTGYESPMAKQLGTNAISKVSSLSSNRFQSAAEESNSPNCHRNYMSKPKVSSYDQAFSQGLASGNAHEMASPQLKQTGSSFANRDFENLDDGSANASSDQFYDRPLPKQQMYVSKTNQIQSNPEARNTSSSNSAQYSSGRSLPTLNAESSKQDKNLTKNRAGDPSTDFKKWNLDDSNCALPKLGADSCASENSLRSLEKDVPYLVKLPPNSGPNYQNDISRGGNDIREFANGNHNQGNTNNNSGIKSPTSKKYEISREIPEGEYYDELPSNTSNLSKRATPEQKNPSWKTERNERYSNTVGENDQLRREFSEIDPAKPGADFDRVQPPHKRAAAGLATELSDNEASEIKRNGGEEKEKERGPDAAARRNFVRPPVKTNDDGPVREMAVPSYRKKKTSFTFNEDLTAKLQNQLQVAQDVKRSEMQTRPDFFNIESLQSRYVPHSEGSNNGGTEATSNEIDPKLDYRRRKLTSDLWVPTFKRM